MMRRKAVGGFTLIELMIVVAIIGILSALAMPNMRIFACRAKTSEAKIALKQLYNLQEAYISEYDTYFSGDQAQLKSFGFQMLTQNRYEYSAIGDQDQFTGQAVGMSTNEMFGDTWYIYDTGEIDWYQMTAACQ